MKDRLLKRQFSMLELMLFPVLLTLSIPLNAVLGAIGLRYFPWFATNCLEVRDWFVRCGVDREVAAQYVPEFVLDIPGIGLLFIFVLTLLLTSTRVGDFAVYSCVPAFPFAYLPTTSLSFDQLINVLKAKFLSIMVCVLLLAAYSLARSVCPRVKSMRTRERATAALIATAFCWSTLLWAKWNDVVLVR
ncbi:MAG: hypothetical protein AAFX06_17940 [Planctomycetota bacterium]